ncbi:MAG: beta strand repeat-containing protein [Gemmataceae bacterium]
MTPATAAVAANTLTINFTATGAIAESVTVNNDGTNISLTGNISGTTTTATANVTKIVFQDSGGGTNQAISFTGTAPFILSSGLDGIGVDTVAVSNEIDVTGSSTLSINAPVTLSVDGNLSTVSGPLTLKANQGATASSGGFDGIDVGVNAPTAVSSVSGNITVQGRGGDDAGGYWWGIFVHTGSIVGSTTTGNVSVTGTGGNNIGTRNYGVFVNSGGTITSGGGNVAVTGTGAGSGAGSYLNFGVFCRGTISATGAGNLTINATGGSPVGSANIGNNHGLVVDSSASITADSGSITVSAVGGVSTDSDNYGIDLAGVISTNSGNLNVTGTGGGGSGYQCFGIFVESTATISSNGGNISVVGNGGGSSTADFNVGVLHQGQILAGGNGNLTIQGTGGVTSGGSDYGLYINGSIGSSGGNVSLTGQGSGTGTSGSNLGILVLSSTISAAGSGNVTVSGTGSNSSGAGNYGINLDSGNISTSGGTVLVTATRGNASSDGLRMQNGSNVGNSSTGATTVSATGTINMISGSVTSNGNITMNATGAITQTAGKFMTPGTMTINDSAQTATLNSFGNDVAQFMIPAGTTVLVNGSFPPTDFVQVAGTLGGSGIAGTVTVISTGAVSPGSSPGKLSTGNIGFNSGSIFSVELNGPNAGTNYDQLAVLGTVTLGGATLQGTVGFLPTGGQQFIIIDHQLPGDVTGTFNGYAEGATVVLSGLAFTISYKGGDGNDVTLTRQSAPAPTVLSVVLDEGTGNTNINGINGTTQRSEVRHIIVTFSEAVNFTGPTAAAFSLSRSNASTSPGLTGPVTLVTNPATGPASSVTITFTGAFADSTGSLVDGVYNFSIDASKVSGAGGQLNGSGGGANTNYTVTGTTANKWYRYYGDQNADGTVDQTDYLVFRNALAGGPNSVFDYQNSGDVDQTDYLEFRNRLAGAP